MHVVKACIQLVGSEGPLARDQGYFFPHVQNSWKFGNVSGQPRPFKFRTAQSI